MKKMLGVMFTLAVMVALSTGSFGQNSEVVGSWDVTIESPQGQRTVLMVIRKDGDKLTGAMKSPQGERPLDSFAVKGDEITFVITRQIQGQEMVMTYKGKIEKGSMKGEADFGGLATGLWSAVPHKDDAGGAASGSAPAGASTAAAASAGTAAQTSGAMNITGAWDFAVETAGGSGTPVFTFKQDGEKLTGTYKGQFGEAPLEGTVKGDAVDFVVKIKAQGQDLTVTYSGKITGKDSMKGAVVLGELGEGTWTAKRKA